MNPKILSANMIVSLLLESLAYRVRDEKDTTDATDTTDTADTALLSVGHDENDRSHFHKQPYECGGKANIIEVPSEVTQKLPESRFDSNTLHYAFETCMVACHHKGIACKGFSYSEDNKNCILKKADCKKDKDNKCEVVEGVEAQPSAKCGGGDWVFWRRDGSDANGAQEGCVVYSITMSGKTTREGTMLTQGYPGELTELTRNEQCNMNSDSKQCEKR
eukprot:TRINITY_DN13387_c0_g2_i1.p1 TRINITY_DN13387_c0_g2~~TRINITY_DN13387_c0_g2_i1.p1  ORF type:complete len:219 (-),score=10.18 TRINITY_DN13387_c0_g2_i1:154-810(-)